MLTLTWANLVQVFFWAVACGIIRVYAAIVRDELLVGSKGEKELEWVALAWAGGLVYIALSIAQSVIK